MKVSHIKFGEGNVISVNDDNSMTIRFKDFGEKTIVYGDLMLKEKMRIIDDEDAQKFFVNKSLEEISEKTIKTQELINSKYDEKKVDFKEFESLNYEENIISDFNKEHSFLSNSYEKPVYFEYKLYNSVADIFIPENFLEIQKENKKKVNPKTLWQNSDFSTLERAVEAKFINPTLRHLLLETGDQYLLYTNNKHDNIYGSCKCKKCKDTEKQNKFGVILMRVRKKLRSKVA